MTLKLKYKSLLLHCYALTNLDKPLLLSKNCLFCSHFSFDKPCRIISKFPYALSSCTRFVASYSLKEDLYKLFHKKLLTYDVVSIYDLFDLFNNKKFNSLEALIKDIEGIKDGETVNKIITYLNHVFDNKDNTNDFEKLKEKDLNNIKQYPILYNTCKECMFYRDNGDKQLCLRYPATVDLSSNSSKICGEFIISGLVFSIIK